MPNHPLRTHFKREKKKRKKRKEKAFGQAGIARAVKVFWKNTSANWRRRFF